MSSNKEGEFLLTRATILPLGVVARLPTIVELGPCLWPGQGGHLWSQVLAVVTVAGSGNHIKFY